jgi:hypothetical protein
MGTKFKLKEKKMKKYERSEDKKEVKEEVKEVEYGFIPTKDTTGDDTELNHSHVSISE